MENYQSIKKYILYDKQKSIKETYSQHFAIWT